MKQAANLKNFRAAMLLPAILVNTSSSDFQPIKDMELVKFSGTCWELFGSMVSGEAGNR